MARLLRLLPDSASPHEPRSVDPSKIAFVSLAAMANQAKPLRGVTPSRRSKVCRSGRSWFTNWALAHVRTSGGPTSPTQRLFRVARSSPNLCARSSLTRSNRRWYGPVCPVVWEGWRREASPYPDLRFQSGVQGRGQLGLQYVDSGRLLRAKSGRSPRRGRCCEPQAISMCPTVVFKFWRPPRLKAARPGGLSGFQALFFIPSCC